MKIQSSIKFYKLLLLVAAFAAFDTGLGAQTYCLTYTPIVNGSTFDVIISLEASGSAFKLGSGNLQFRYKTACITTPTLISNSLATNGRYNGISVTAFAPPSFAGTGDGLASLNFNFTGSLGTGLPIALSGTVIAIIEFQILNGSLSPNLRPYDNGTAGTVVYTDDPNSPILLTTTGGCPSYDIALPLEWLDFQAHATTDKSFNKVDLEWVTASEQNIQHFIIERSRDGKTFEKTGDFIPPHNTNSKNYYHIVDDQPWTGVSFYRIHGVDLDGKTSYSPIRSVVFDNDKHTFTVYPNPKDQYSPLSIQTNSTENYTFNLYDVTGKLIYTRLCKGSLELESFDLKSGLYIYECNTLGSKASGKIIVP